VGYSDLSTCFSFTVAKYHLTFLYEYLKLSQNTLCCHSGLSTMFLLEKINLLIHFVYLKGYKSITHLYLNSSFHITAKLLNLISRILSTSLFYSK